MSSSLSWVPPPKIQKENYVDLKHEVGRYFEEDYNGGNGSWTGTHEMIPFLQGIISVGEEYQKRDAQELIDAIKKYGEIVFKIR